MKASNHCSKTTPASLHHDESKVVREDLRLFRNWSSSTCLTLSSILRDAVVTREMPKLVNKNGAIKHPTPKKTISFGNLQNRRFWTTFDTILEHSQLKLIADDDQFLNIHTKVKVSTLISCVRCAVAARLGLRPRPLARSPFGPELSISTQSRGGFKTNPLNWRFKSWRI